jgi:hypothetical protein
MPSAESLDFFVTKRRKGPGVATRISIASIGAREILAGASKILALLYCKIPTSHEDFSARKIPFEQKPMKETKRFSIGGNASSHGSRPEFGGILIATGIPSTNGASFPPLPSVQIQIPAFVAALPRYAFLWQKIRRSASSCLRASV